VDSRDQLPVINDQPSSQKQSHQEKEKKKKFLVSGFPKARNLFFLWFSCASFEVFCFLALPNKRKRPSRFHLHRTHILTALKVFSM
jgi:hypothetical protein